MASYKYTTEIYRDNNLVYCGNFKSLKKQISMLHSLVINYLTNERFSKYDVDYTITEYTKALRKKTCSKRKYYYAYDKGNGDKVKLIRIGTEK